MTYRWVDRWTGGMTYGHVNGWIGCMTYGCGDGLTGSTTYGWVFISTDGMTDQSVNGQTGHVMY